MPTLEAFEEQSGIDVIYRTDINDNNEFFSNIANQLGDCRPINRDIITLTDWMAARTVKLGWLQGLDKGNLPNVEKNLRESLRAPTGIPSAATACRGRAGSQGSPTTPGTSTSPSAASRSCSPVPTSSAR
jgi:spermidine/putrescine transport system substrate-binding protein